MVNKVYADAHAVTLVERAPGVTVPEVRVKTEANYRIALNRS